MKTHFYPSAMLAICLILSGGCASRHTGNTVPAFDWAKPGKDINLSWAKETGARQFPRGGTFNANSYGAVNDTTVRSTEAIQKAIDDCHGKGGGTVTLDPGKYTTGALFLKNNVNLEIGKDVLLYADTDISQYPEMPTRVAGIEMTWPSAVLNIIDCRNAAVSGEGIIDCRGKVFWDKYWDMRKDYEARGLRWIVDYDAKRVRGILVSGSTDITLKDFTIRRTGFWGIQVLYSSYCTADGLNVNNNFGGHGPSTDGIDIDSSTYVLIENCEIDCNDDNICLKAGRDADGLRVNRPTEYIVIRNCIARKGAGLITCGSETSGSIRNILGYNLKACGTSAVLRLKSAMNRGGTVENIFISDVEAEKVKVVLAADLNWNPSYSYSQLPPEYNGQEIPQHWKVMLTPVEPEEKGYPAFSNVYLANVEAAEVQQFISASGWNDDLKLTNFNLFNINVECKKGGRINFTDRFTLEKINLMTEGNDEILFSNNTNMTSDIRYSNKINE